METNKRDVDFLTGNQPLPVHVIPEIQQISVTHRSAGITSLMMRAYILGVIDGKRIDRSRKRARIDGSISL